MIARFILLLAIGAMAASAPPAALAQDPLPSWAEGPNKAAILDFVADVTTESSPDYLPQVQRIAVFDNDGTLWVEQPAYAQGAFIVDRIAALAPDHPEWAGTEPYKAVIAQGLAGLSGLDTDAIGKLVMATHAGMTTDEFATIVSTWMRGSRHPRFDRPYDTLVYQPMRELLDHFRANGFLTYIVSGGGIEFMRPWSEAVYGIPPHQVIGSSIKTEFKLQDGVPVLIRLPELDFIDDKEGKPIAINRFIGQRPIAVFGNSDGDLQMLQWGTAGEGRRLGGIVHHDDATREYAYDRESHVGRLDAALDAAGPAGWLVISMAKDWTRLFPGD